MRYSVFADLMRKDLEALLGAPAPVVFTRPSRPVPLQIGIREEMLARYPNADEAKVGRFLRIWCSQLFYRRALTVGRARYSLDYQITDAVTEDAEARAKRQIEHDLRKPKKMVGQSGRKILRLQTKQAAQQVAGAA